MYLLQNYEMGQKKKKVMVVPKRPVLIYMDKKNITRPRSTFKPSTLELHDKLVPLESALLCNNESVPSLVL